MEFYTLSFDSAKSIFLGQLLSSSVESFLISQQPKRLGSGPTFLNTKLTRLKVKEGTLDSVALRELTTKASEEFNEAFERTPVELVKFFRFEAFKAIRPCDGGRNREYAFIVQYEIPSAGGLRQD